MNITTEFTLLCLKHLQCRTQLAYGTVPTLLETEVKCVHVAVCGHI